MNRSKNYIVKFRLLTVIIAMALLSAYCKKPQTSPDEPDTTFAKQEMLVNMADQVILPAYSEFKVALGDFAVSAEVFFKSNSEADLKIVRTKLDVVYLKYQTISPYGFGPADEQGVRVNFNIFPTDTLQINKNIASGAYNLGTASNIAAKGLPALDFLFYGLNKNESQTCALFATANRKKYASDLITELTVKTNAVVNGWTSYRSEFVNSLSTDISSSIGYLVNQMNLELDYLKNAKIGIPLGLKSDGQILPNNSEALYSGQSLPYAIKTLETIEDLYLGRSASGNNGLGFDDYLDHLGAKRGDEFLNTAIKRQFASAFSKMNLIKGPFSQEVVANPAVVTEAYTELVKLLVLLKTDLPSSLGVVITYQDGDGD